MGLIILAVILAVILSGFSGLAGALTGAGASKSLRRVGVPLISSIFALALLLRWQMIFIMTRAGALSQGYGIPSPDDPKPSKLGKFWYGFFSRNNDAEEVIRKNTRIAVRATIGVQDCSVLLIIPMVTGHWFWFPLACAGIIWTWVYFGALKDNEGTFQLFGKTLLWEEFEIHAITSFIYSALALLCR